MKKNKLYTANRWNQPLFMERNLFRNGGSTNPFGVNHSAPTVSTPKIDWSNPVQRNMALGQIKGLINSFSSGNPNNLQQSNQMLSTTISDKTSGVDGGGSGLSSKGGAGWGMAGAAAGALGSANTGDPRGMWDTLDPVYHLADGRESAAGNAMSDAGVSLTQAGLSSGNSYLALAGAGLKIIGGLTNAAFGIKENADLKKDVEAGISRNKNFVSNAGSFDEVQGPVGAATNTDVYKGGWFSGGKARRKNEELKRRMIAARDWANRSVDNNVLNLVDDQKNDALANFSAFGGPLDNNIGMGAIGYGFMSDYLTQKKKETEAKNKITGISPMPIMNTFGHGGCFNPFALGGDIEVPQDNTKVFRPMMLPIQRQQNFSDSEYFWDAGKGYPAGLWKHKDGTFHTTGSYGKDIVLTQEEADSIIRATKAKNRREKLRKAMENHKQTNSSENLFAFGGDMQTNSSDFPTGLMHIDAGGSHEMNPNDGVQIGIDQQGIPNLVEEGERIFNNYVFSKRIYADGGTLEKFHLSKKRKITFADLAELLEKEIAERPNDPLSQAGFTKQMEMLEEQQERQKQEMDAQRAKEAFEALSPEEQVAVMENAAQEEAMAEQAAMQQPSPEEIAMAQQQQAMADGSQAALGQEPQMMAEGGKINRFDWGSIADLFTNPDAAIIASKGKNRLPWNAKKGDYAKQREAEQDYKDWTQYVLDNWDSEQVQNYLKALDERAGGKHLSYAAEDAAAREAARKYWTDARQDGKWGYYHYTPIWEEKAKEVLEEKAPAVTPEARVFHAMDGDDYDGYIEGELDPNVVGAEVRRETLPNGDTVIYHSRAKTLEEKKAEEEKGVAPKHRAEWLRYAGLFGPAVGLGLMGLGVGKPDTAQLDATIEGAGDVTPADWKPLGNYLTYRPLDIWFEQNALNAQSRATDRALMNTSSGNRGTAMAGLLANGYNSQVASGNLFRQAQEYNDNLRKQVAEFNRGTDQFNSEQFGATSRFNADAYNNARRANAQLRLQAAAQKMDADAGWYNSLYGNIAGLFKGIGDIGTENFRMNRIGEMAARGDFGTATDETYGFEPYLTRSNRKSKKNR